jgi:hypothetical protein
LHQLHIGGRDRIVGHTLEHKEWIDSTQPKIAWSQLKV